MMFSLGDFFDQNKPKNGRFFTIAIDGRGGSGKSLLAEYLRDKHPELYFLEGDDYFEPTKDGETWGDFNEQRFSREVIEPLKQGSSFTYKKYDWHKQSEPQAVKIGQGFCVERCYSFEFDLDWDLKIWVETPKEICLERGLAREHMPRDQVLHAWEQVWQPREDEYIERVKPLETADLIINGTELFDTQIS